MGFSQNGCLSDWLRVRGTFLKKFACQIVDTQLILLTSLIFFLQQRVTGTHKHIHTHSSVVVWYGAQTLMTVSGPFDWGDGSRDMMEVAIRCEWQEAEALKFVGEGRWQLSSLNTVSLSAYVFVSPFLPIICLLMPASLFQPFCLLCPFCLSVSVCFYVFLPSLGDGWIYFALSSLRHILHCEEKKKRKKQWEIHK